MDYDADATRAFFDDYGEREWERLERSLTDRVSFELHRRLLARFIAPGDRVLDAGAGPGRFTIELARLGARIAAFDISGVQLTLHRRQVALAGCEDAVLSREIGDVVDLGRYGDGSFDAALAYGGVLSYVFRQRDRALTELLRVVRPGGRILLSVMSLVGATSRGLPGVLRFYEESPERVARVLSTGDLEGDLPGTHPCHMYRYRELADWLSGFPCRLLAASASGVLARAASVDDAAALGPRTDLFRRLCDWEEELSGEPGALDLGTHILVALERA